MRELLKGYSYMPTFTITKQKPSACNTSTFIFLLEDNFLLPTELAEVGSNYRLDIPAMLVQRNFTGKEHQICEIITMIGDKLMRVFCVGLGKKKNNAGIDLEVMRRALATTYRRAAAQKIESCAVVMPEASLFGVSPYELTKQIVIALEMTSYHFNDFITDQERKGTEIFDITLCNVFNDDATQHGVKDGLIIARAVNKARHWIDMPPSLLTPPHLTDKAEQIFKDHPEIKLTIFNEEEINHMGMGGLAGVSRGSEIECRLLIMEYYASKPKAPTLALVGKGITFDSGGLSIKPAQAMETMKDDMSGAAAVVATMEAVAQLKPDINILCVAPLAENLPSGKATKPGDIVRFYNGKTAEVRNTDAEGRLILADALSYVVKHYKPDAIIDIATLTGACAYALGPFYSALLSEHEDLITRIQQASVRTGERVWRLPLDEDYKRAIRSDVADICNIGKSAYKAGTITATHFLQHFVADIPWAHLDIAGTAFEVPDIPYYRSGATGVGVRLFVDLIMNWQK